MAIQHQIKDRFETKNHEIVANLRTAAGAGAPVDPAMRVKRLIAEVAIQMALLHGGDWTVETDLEAGFVLVRRRNQRRKSG